MINTIDLVVRIIIKQIVVDEGIVPQTIVNTLRLYAMGTEDVVDECVVCYFIEICIVGERASCIIEKYTSVIVLNRAVTDLAVVLAIY